MMVRPWGSLEGIPQETSRPRGSLDEFPEDCDTHLDVSCGPLQSPSSEELSQLLEIKVVCLVRVSGGGSLGSTSKIYQS